MTTDALSAAPQPPAALALTLQQLHHVAFATPSLDDAIALHTGPLGGTLRLRETLPARGVDVAWISFPCGGPDIELLAPLAGSDATPVGKFLAQRGPGMHHVGYLVGDINTALQSLGRSLHPDGQPIELIDTTPQPGSDGTLVAFIHPRSVFGVLIELVQKVSPTGAAEHSTQE